MIRYRIKLTKEEVDELKAIRFIFKSLCLSDLKFKHKNGSFTVEPLTEKEANRLLDQAKIFMDGYYYPPCYADCAPECAWVKSRRLNGKILTLRSVKLRLSEVVAGEESRIPKIISAAALT